MSHLLHSILWSINMVLMSILMVVIHQSQKFIWVKTLISFESPSSLVPKLLKQPIGFLVQRELVKINLDWKTVKFFPRLNSVYTLRKDVGIYLAGYRTTAVPLSKSWKVNSVKWRKHVASEWVMFFISVMTFFHISCIHFCVIYFFMKI